MSNALTRAARPLLMPANDKAVLMALADMARDPDAADKPCQAWPPMHGKDGAVGLCDWTCLSERAVQRAVKALVAAGLIARRQLSHGALYTLQLTVSPVPQSGDCQSGDPQSGDCQSPSPVPQSPKALGSTIRKKKTSSSPSKRTVATIDYPMPDGVDPQAWTDFLANRKRKRLPNTASAHKTLIEDLARHRTDSWPNARLIAHAAGKGWASVRNPEKDDRYGTVQRGHQPSHDRIRGPRPDPSVDLWNRANAQLAAEGSGEDPDADSGAGLSLPSYLTD